MHQALITTDDLYSTELFIRNAMDFELLHRIPESDKPSFRAALLRKDRLTLMLMLKKTSEPGDHSLNTNQNVIIFSESNRKQILKLLDSTLKGDFHVEETFEETHSYPHPEGIIFDLDGTLIDSEPNYYESDRILMEEYGVEFSEEMKKKYVGVGNSFMMEDLRRTYNLSDSMEALLEKKNRYYMDIARRNTKTFPEMKKLVERLAEEGYKLAIASGSSPEVIEELTEIVGVRKYFERLVSSEEVLHGKPAPDIFIEAARRLGIKTSEAIVLEDTQYGVEAAVRAGMRCVAIPTINNPLDVNFRMADLLFAEGMNTFNAEAFFRWLEKY